MAEDHQTLQEGEMGAVEGKDLKKERKVLSGLSET